MMKKTNTNNQFTNSNIKYLIKTAWKEDKKSFIFLFLFTVSNILLSLISVFTPKFIIDGLTEHKSYMKLLAIILLIFGLSAVMKFLSSFLQGVLTKRILKLRFLFVSTLQKKCLEMDFEYIEDPDILNENRNAWKACQGSNFGIESVYATICNCIPNLITILVFLFILSHINVFFVILVFVIIVISNFFIFKAKIYQHSMNTKISDNERRSDYIQNTMINFSYGKEMRVYNLKKFFTVKYTSLVTDRLNIENKITLKILKANIIELILTFIRDTLAFGYLIYNVLYNNMDIGTFTMYISIIIVLNIIVPKFILDVAHIHSQNLYIDDYKNFIQKQDKINTNKIMDIPIERPLTIEFSNVSFKYPFSGKYIYKNLNLKIVSGQKLAIVGINGAGKTTFVKLLTRLYDPTEGEILLNGINIKNFDIKEYFRLFSIVFQDSKLFAFTVGENIALTEHFNEDKVLHSMDCVGMSKKIKTLDKSINTSVLKYLDENGVIFSGGEVQKLTLARAIYKNGDVVILDEPTASLDAIEESNIYNSFNNIIGYKTAIYISHRLASTIFCDVIALFENGQVKEYGSHSELLSKRGKYSQLFELQAAYYKDNGSKEDLDYENIRKES